MTNSEELAREADVAVADQGADASTEALDLGILTPAMRGDTEMIDRVRAIREEAVKKDDPQAHKVVAEADRILAVLTADRWEVDLSIFHQLKPRTEEFKYPKRAELLAQAARKRMAKSKYMFPEPAAVLNAVEGLCASPEVAERVRLHVASYMSRVNIFREGLPVSLVMRNVIHAYRSGGEAREKAKAAVARFAAEAGYVQA